MKKKLLASLLLLSMLLAGCGTAKTQQGDDSAVDAGTTQQGDPDTVLPALRVAGLKGPTSMGLVQMMDAHADQSDEYEFQMFTGADEIMPLIAKGEIDIALLPANVAAILYQKTEGKIQVIDINTLSVLEVVTADASVQTVNDLVGKQLYLTGKGTTPEYVLQYVLAQNDLTMDQLTVEFKAEAAEVVSALSEDPEAVGILPQPFASVATTQNESLKIAMHLGDAWAEAAPDGSQQVTGVTVARTAVDAQQLEKFVEDHAASVAYVNENVEEAAALVESFEIVKAAIAQKAIPSCNLVCLSGEEMQTALSGYLAALYEMNPETVGGKLPDEAFYWSK